MGPIKRTGVGSYVPPTGVVEPWRQAMLRAFSTLPPRDQIKEAKNFWRSLWTTAHRVVAALVGRLEHASAPADGSVRVIYAQLPGVGVERHAVVFPEPSPHRFR